MTHPQEVPVDVVIKPIMYYNIPCAVIVSKWSGVPPVLEKKKISMNNYIMAISAFK